MKKTFKPLTLLIILIFTFIISDQSVSAGPFTFSASTPSAPAVTTVNINLTVASGDEFDTLINPGGFNIYFDGINYSKFIVSSNGWLALTNGSTIPATIPNPLPNNSLRTYSGGLPLIAPLWDDDSCTQIKYGVSGNILTVIWVVKWDKTSGSAFDSLMWTTLDGNTGVISFNYSTTTYTSGVSNSASIGIAGTCNGDFYSVTPYITVSSSTVSNVTEDSLVNLKPINAKFVFTPSNLVWQGTIDTTFNLPANWDSCSIIPNCYVDAVIDTTASGRMPTIINNQSVRNLTIRPGATLRIKAPFTLDVCGDFINNGTLIAEPGSTINFTGTGVQTVSGSLINLNSFSNFKITKASGNVTLATDIDVNLNFTVSNSTGIFNINGRYMKVGGNFMNYNGATTIGVDGSTIEFNGIDNQFYSNSNGDDTLCNVTINKPSGKLYMTNNHSNMNIDSTLRLIFGYIVTTPSLEVNLLYGSPSAIQLYSKDSYIDGRLRRKLYGIGSVDFPLGDSLVPNPGIMKGYELANITFTSTTIIPDLLAWFNNWIIIPPSGRAGPDYCMTDTASYNSLPLYDNGYWSFQRNSSAFNGAYNVTLYNTGGTNSAGDSAWTVATAPIASNPISASSWGLIGNCNYPSTLQNTNRDLFNLPASMSTSFNHLYVTAQGIAQSSNSVDEINNSDFIMLVPNPTHDQSSLIIQSEYLEKIKIEIFTMTGQKINSSIINIVKGKNVIPLIDEHNLIPEGIYNVTIESEKFRRNVKLIIQ